MAARTKVAIYGSEAVRAAFDQWLLHFRHSINRVGMREVFEGDLSELPTLKDELFDSSQSMEVAARQLSDVMNKELAS
ncbi:hypothetical protein SAMN05421811_10162 [Nonomuraea wenchangensis]|uniref:Uncharacterized protein n=2 Tax=Nonomuraea wenchangensis TaxID=568860 RepID=A0A1H9YJ37_9ACTN|nr:hypothetical protein SAMN05421811_10162 [Nonomuraea wenchangensis]